MVVNPSVPANTVPEFIAYAKTNPGKLNMASPGAGTAPHVAGELFKMMTSINHDPRTLSRRRARADRSVWPGRCRSTSGSGAGAIEYIRAGKLRALAVTSATRSEVLPDVPTVAEFVPGFEASAWYGIGAPKNTPTAIVEKLNKEINAGLADIKLRARLADLGGTVLPGSPAEFGKLIADETEKWAKVVKFSGAKAN